MGPAASQQGKDPRQEARSGRMRGWGGLLEVSAALRERRWWPAMATVGVSTSGEPDHFGGMGSVDSDHGCGGKGQGGVQSGATCPAWAMEQTVNVLH